MERLFTRRSLFEVLAGGAVVAGSEPGFVRRPAHREITEDVLAFVQDRSKLLAPSIFTPDLGSPTGRASINKDAIAESLLLLAFLDGGDKTVDNVARFVVRHKLTVSVITSTSGQFELDLPNTRGIALVLDDNLVKKYLTFKQDDADEKDEQQTRLVNSIDRILIRPLANVVQQGRDPDNYEG